jgi:hypothetical protein
MKFWNILRGGVQAIQIREPLCYVNIFLIFYIKKKAGIVVDRWLESKTFAFGVVRHSAKSLQTLGRAGHTRCMVQRVSAPLRGCCNVMSGPTPIVSLSPRGVRRQFTVPCKMLCTRRYGSVAKNQIVTLLLLHWMSKQLASYKGHPPTEEFLPRLCARKNIVRHKTGRI